MNLARFAHRGSPERGTVVPPAPAETARLDATGFQKLKTQLHRQLIESLDLSRIAQWDQARLEANVRALAVQLLDERGGELSATEAAQLLEELVAESFGLGPLEPYLADPEVTDILVNGPQEVYVERSGQLELTGTVFADDAHLLQTIQRVVARVGRRVDELSPMVDARLADGSRVNAVIPPLALNGPTLSIRRFGARPLEMEDLLSREAVAEPIVRFLQAAIQGRINLLISGGAGAGKTTLLNCLSRFVPGGERLVTIEDSAELKLQRRHVVRLETRPVNHEGYGEISARDMVRNSLRMRPDRIIVGEVRGPEALDMLQAMNTGHEGSMTTIHANDARDALARLEVMVSMAGLELPISVVQRYISSAITLVVHLARLKGGVRRVLRVAELSGLAEGQYELTELFGFRQSGLDDLGRARGSFYATGRRPALLSRLAEQGIEIDADWFTEGTI